jgi:hypothetical protein
MNGPFTCVDPSQMKTPIGREIAERIRVGTEIVEKNANRWLQVIREYFLYTRSSQLDLADAAILLAFSALAKSVPNNECNRNFEAYIDMMYVHTDDARMTLTESERENILAEAASTRESVRAGVSVNLKTCLAILSALGKNDPIRMCAELLCGLTPNVLDHAPPDCLCELTQWCVNLYPLMGCVLYGIEPESSLQRPIFEISQSAAKTHGAVMDAIKDGKLVVKDGKIYPRDSA